MLKDTDVAGEALGRLLTKEERISDLAAFLAALDPQPLLRVLDLTARDPRVSREEVLGGGVGRADLVLRDGTRPLAVLEIKSAAAQHGDQYERYDLWARAQVPKVRCYLISLDGKPRDAPDGWVTELTLPVLLRSWQGSQHPHAGWLASSAADVLEGWMAQLDGKIGRATNPVVADLVARRVAVGLASVDRLTDAGLEVEATRTSGGTAMIVAWLPFPSEPRDPGAWLCVDLRSMNRADPQVPWLLRLGVEVEDKAPRTTGQARGRGGERVEGRGVAREKREARELGAYVCLEEEGGQGLRAQKGRSWEQRGASELVKVRGEGGGRVSKAGWAARGAASGRTTTSCWLPPPRGKARGGAGPITGT